MSRRHPSEDIEQTVGWIQTSLEFEGRNLG